MLSVVTTNKETEAPNGLDVIYLRLSHEVATYLSPEASIWSL